jgi:hypothetical protein
MSKAVGRLTTDDGRPATDRVPATLRLSVISGRWSVGWRGELVCMLAVAVLAVLLVAIGFNWAWPLTIDIGAQDRRFVAGFNDPEQFGDPSSSSGQVALVRWTTAEATIALPRPPFGANMLLELRLLAARPADQPDAHVALSLDGRPLGEFDVVRIVGGSQIYRVLGPPAERFDWAARLALQSNTFTLPNDPRTLGTVVERVTIAPAGGGILLPSLWLTFWSAALGLLAYGLPRSAGLGRALALALAALLVALVAWGVAARPLELLPFVHRIAALLALGCLGIWLARLLAPPFVTTDDRPFAPAQGRRPTTKELGRKRWSVVSGRWSVRGVDLPIYLAVAWWAAPVFQWIQTADGAVNVTPSPATSWIGGALALALLALCGWYALRGRVLPRERLAAVVARAALIVFALAAAVHLGYMIWFAFQRQGPDFWILFKGARDWARGGSLYDLEAVRTNHFGHVFKVPPFYGMLFVPWVFQDGERILFWHRVLNCVLIGTTAIVWLRMWGLRFFSLAAASVLILLNFRPMTDTLAFGQIDLALLLTLTLALWALRADRDVLAGVLIALGTLFKIYPVLLLVFLVVKRRWRGLAGFALGMLLFNGVAVAVMGWEMHRVYLTEVLPSIGGTTSWVENQTISGFLARFVASPTESEIFKDHALALLGLGISGLIGLAGCVLVLPPARSRDTSFALQYSLFPLLMVLVVPAAWMHYETLLFLPFAALLRHVADREISLPRAVALALSFALIGYGNQWSFYDGTVMGILTIAGVSYKFYGMLLFSGVLAATLLAERAPAWADVHSFLPARLRGAGLRAPLPRG